MPFRPTFAIVVAIVVASACSAASPAVTPSGGPATAPSSIVPTGQSDLDRAFIDMMVPHHQAAVEMARIAQERATRDELRSLADDIVRAQEAEIGQLREWRTSWFGSAETPGMDEMPLMPGMEMPGMDGMSMEGTMDMTADIEALRTAEPFDRAFIEAMIPHHESAIAAAEIVAASTAREELKTLAAGIIAAQQREIDQMQEWLASWYPS